VPAKKPTTIVIEATPAGRAAGTVSGTVEVFEKVQGAEETTTQIPFRFDMARGVDEARRLLLALVLLIAGLGLPLAVLFVINAVGARFQALDAVRGAAIPVRVKGSTVQRTDASYPRPLALRAEDFVSLAATGHDRRFTFGGVVFRARASRNPFGGTIALAAPEGGAEKLKGGEGSRVELDPSLAGSWIFLLDAERTRRAGKGDIDGLLIAFVAEGDLAPQVNRMLPDIGDRLPATASSLAGLVRETRRKGPSKRQQKAAAARAAAEAAPSTPADDPEPIEGSDAAPDEPGAGASADAPVSAATPQVGGEPEPVPTADPDDAAATDGGDDAPAASSAPAGFGGIARSAAPSTLPPSPEADDDDDGPGGPPVGFSGIRPG
jgi:hypothetical protein